MDLPVGDSFTAWICATIGLVTGLTGGVLWFPKLYIAIPVILCTSAAYGLFAAVLMRHEGPPDVSTCKKTALLCVVNGFALLAFTMGGICLTTQLCTLSTYAEWLWGNTNPCGVCVSGDVFLCAAVIFWFGAACYTGRGARKRSLRNADKSWCEETVSGVAV